jgi:hypothetical protein
MGCEEVVLEAEVRYIYWWGIKHICLCVIHIVFIYVWIHGYICMHNDIYVYDMGCAEVVLAVEVRCVYLYL